LGPTWVQQEYFSLGAGPEHGIGVSQTFVALNAAAAAPVNGIHEVTGSIPVSSTESSNTSAEP
jgi:hypothetical protein